MSLSVAIGLFFIVVVIYNIFVEVYTVLFRISGMSPPKARFQVVSLLTNSGYTTAESELVLTSPFRRRLASNVMLFGYIFSATIISVIVNAAMNIPWAELEGVGIDLFIVIAIFVLVLIVIKVTPFKDFIAKRIGNWGRKKLAAEEKNSISVLDNIGNAIIAQIYIDTVPKELCGVPLKDAKLAGAGITPMLLHRNGEDIIAKDCALAVEQKDFLIVRGALVDIYKYFAMSNIEEHIERIKKARGLS